MKKQIFISGGAGFIGSNVAWHYLKKGHRVVVFDNLSRHGTERNAKWLSREGGSSLCFVKRDVRDLKQIRKSIRGSSIVYHAAGQVAVTTSLVNPLRDFEINALGSLNMLEATRLECPEAVFLYTSTNKVYGELVHAGYREGKTRYSYMDRNMNKGVSESQPIDFHSPYGCSKGCGDQYTRDYHRVYGLRTVVLRQSCIYGPRQFGNEDQGWVMHFALSMLKKRALTIYGNGKQVRDILHMSDLMRVYALSIEKIDTLAGEILNIGGGPSNTVSIIELVEMLGRRLNAKADMSYERWREGDQKIYVSDISKAERLLSWKPRIAVEKGLDQLIRWAGSI